MPNGELGIGLLGAGGVGRAHAEAYRKRRDGRLVAVADVDEARGRAFAAEYGAAWVRDWRDLLARADVTAVSICLPHALHAPAVLDAAAAGKHVLCEKPIATSLEDADRMIAACRAAGVTLMVGQTHRFRLEHVKAKALLDSGAIGKLLQVRDVIFAGRDAPRPMGWRGVTALAGGGVFMDNGVHAADRLRWWLDDEVAWVAARTGRAADLVEGEDYGVALLSFRRGAIATLEQALSVPRAAGTCYAEFVGTEGNLRVDTWGGLRLATRGRPWEDVPLPADQPNGFDAEIGAFFHAVQTGRPPAVSGEAGRAALEIVLAIYAAAHRGGVVTLPLDAGQPAPGG